MRHLWLLVGMLGLVVSGPVWAASYQDIYGVVHDPIQNVYGEDLAYSGGNLEPFANLSYENLSYADLPLADLKHVDLSYANLTRVSLPWADLTDAYLSSANLYNADLTQVILNNANLTGSRLFSADLGGAESWSVATWTGAKYSLNAVDNSGNPIEDTIFPAGMDQAWRDNAGMVAVPEPATALLLGLGLVGLAGH